MATEILGFLIIVGILIVFIVRRDLWNGTSSKADEVEEASVKMRLQMEHSANAIITQMDSRIHQLEGLVSAADERARTLEQQLASVRADQERARERAEREFAAMRAAQAPYYTPQEELYTAPRRSLSPIEGVGPVHRPQYTPRVRPRRGPAEDDFAETLSASMYAVESAYNGAPRGNRARYYEGAGQEPRGTYSRERYSEPYETVSYPEEPYPSEAREEDLEQYLEQPRYVASSRRPSRPAQGIPAEMAVEETPAVILDAQLSQGRESYRYEEPEEDEPAFSPEQLEELARTEAEIVVSSSVADVVDLPMQTEGEEAPEEEGMVFDANEDVVDEEITDTELMGESGPGDEEPADMERELYEERRDATLSSSPEEEPEPTEAEVSSPEDKAEETGIYGGGEIPDIAPKEPQPSSTADRARALLAQGMDPDAVARETGMGRSALGLLAQMVQGAAKAEAAD